MIASSTPFSARSNATSRNVETEATNARAYPFRNALPRGCNRNRYAEARDIPAAAHASSTGPLTVNTFKNSRCRGNVHPSERICRGTGI